MIMFLRFQILRIELAIINNQIIQNNQIKKLLLKNNIYPFSTKIMNDINKYI